jgi:hypothetical protein
MEARVNICRPARMHLGDRGGLGVLGYAVVVLSFDCIWFERIVKLLERYGVEPLLRASFALLGPGLEVSLQGMGRGRSSHDLGLVALTNDPLVLHGFRLLLLVKNVVRVLTPVVRLSVLRRYPP